MTASKLRLAWLGLLSVLAASGAWAATADTTIKVDCDHGGDLAAVLRDVGPGPARILVIGTCDSGLDPTQLIQTSGDGIEIVGLSPAESRIRGFFAGIALRVTGPGNLTLRNLTISDAGRGLDIHGPGRTVIVEGCDITANRNFGILAETGVTLYLIDSQVQGSHDIGVGGAVDVNVLVSGGAIWRNRQGFYLADHCTLDLRDTEVRQNYYLGVLAQTLCSVTATGTTFLDNGDVHAAVVDRSVLGVVDSKVGQPEDATTSSLYGVDNSQTFIYSRASGVVYGTTYAVRGSNLLVEGATLNNGATLQDFSWVKLTDARVEGTLSCETGSDAICAGHSSASVFGCGPVSASCNGKPVTSSEAPAFLKILPKDVFGKPQRAASPNSAASAAASASRPAAR